MCLYFQTTTLSDICEKLVIGPTERPLDPLYLQPASLEQAVIRKKQGEELVSTMLQQCTDDVGARVIVGIKPVFSDYRTPFDDLCETLSETCLKQPFKGR